MRLTVIGCSDAFGSGGRFQSCYLLDTQAGRLMIDCGANSPLALKRAAIPAQSIDAIIISHCHGDHFGGLPFLFLDKMFVQQSPRPIKIFGPAGIKSRVEALLEALYPRIGALPRNFDIAYEELDTNRDHTWRNLSISAFEVEHYSGSPSLAVIIEAEGRRFAYSGDSGWCKGVVEAGRQADLYLIECTFFQTRASMHLDYATLATKFEEIGAQRYMLTHMSEEMLQARNSVDASKCILADDGLSFTI